MPVFKQLNAASEKISDTFERRITSLRNLMVVVCDFSNGPASQPDPPHSHPHEQITYVAEGDLYFLIEDEKHHLTKGDLYSVPSGIPHCIQTISKHVRLVDCFTPLREDFLKKSGN
jgi:quercetin dioxygenase-like cupin family protein